MAINYTKPENSTLVIILGGGRGDRLFPLTKMRSKPAVPLAGKYRLIDIPVSNCLHSRLNRIFVLTQFNSASLNQHIARTYHFDSFSNGFVEILAAEQTIGSQEWFQGTADAVRKIFPHIGDREWKYILILSGDHLYRMNLTSVIEQHIQKEAEVTICVKPVTASAAGNFGLLKVDETTRIFEFAEKPKGEDILNFRIDSSETHPYIASMGIYVFNRKTLQSILFDNPGLIDFGKQIIPEAIKKHKVMAYIFKDYWEDIGTIKTFFEANMSLCQRHPPFQLFHPSRPIYTHQRHLAGSTIIDSSIIQSIINEGCLIQNATIKNSIIGIRTSIHTGVTIEGSLILGADYYDNEADDASPGLGIGKNSRITGAIVDKNVKIGENVIIENKNKLKEYDDPHGRYYIREGIVIIAKNSLIPDNTHI